ncbi:hypothetical protein C9F11_06900 [Streptomyces sp. YIM 121038]|uniref:DUF6879 family protein n=1 Tax=Streptomyces sp. YIM 121038 TaxID=2136401 RepID=UPI001110103E|nr:DUF6879 family protein [Streptomyces sp. YIM 121038]QCX75080.1 hypothetical protein C9F11_06900 [Streptomyces sp. YIM 121038]
MARRLWKVGTNSGNDGCPTLYEVPGSDRFVVQGATVIDPKELGQLERLAKGESAVVVPRELLANFGPKEPVHVPQFITFDEFTSMFTTLKHSAWRLETRGRYASDEATDTYAQFLAEGRVDWDFDDPWCRGRREQAALGKRFERVRVLDEPPTAGQLYLLDNARRNTAVGEDIRVLTRGKAVELGLPDQDFWVFDSRAVGLLHFDDGDEITRVELITDPVQVLRYAQAREAAWHHAIPYDQA